LNYSSRSLRRRPRIERRVLAILRGEDDPLLNGNPDNAFVRLNHLARRKGLVIHAADNVYLGDDELSLLSWLAASQRASAQHLRPADHCLAAVIRRCADLLDDAGVRLYPLSLYWHRLQPAISTHPQSNAERARYLCS